MIFIAIDFMLSWHTRRFQYSLKRKYITDVNIESWRQISDFVIMKSKPIEYENKQILTPDQEQK